MTRLSDRAACTLFDTLDSTSAEARRRADEAVHGPHWFVALRQTAGYGRRGRPWSQGEGDFSGSLLFAPGAQSGVSKDRFGELSFVAALAVHDVVQSAVAKGEVRIKWPNDILIDAAKVSGLLLEMVETAASEPHGRAALILGIGVNIVTRPDDAPYPATRLIDHLDAGGETVALKDLAPLEMARRLDAAFWLHYDHWLAKGFAPLRAAWLDRAAGLGEAITVRMPAETVEGVFADLDEAGRLVLHMPAGTRKISAGDVFFGAPRKDA